MALRKHSPAAGEFLFEIDPEPLQECVTALGGIRLLVRAARSLDVTECCEVDYVPEETGNPYREPLRYVAIRIRKKQRALFADGSTVKYFAVVSNVWEWTPKRLLEWHRVKAGSIEAVHDVIKNELAGGVMPCGRFGSNAAWVPAGSADLQRADRSEAASAAAGVAHGTAQATTFSYLQHSREIGASRAQHPAAIGL